jgi:hypothetical protein
MSKRGIAHAKFNVYFKFKEIKSILKIGQPKTNQTIQMWLPCGIADQMHILKP